MKAEDYLTQEMIDKLQDDIDDNNGIIDWEDLEPLLDGFKEQLLRSNLVVPKGKLCKCGAELIKDVVGVDYCGNTLCKKK